ncbi:CBS and ACT domain-containing protein [Traorella massiliensis]|uniref:CBS and ACT domain-containing protein n=1 Tax=Traorella massiliensis TaxID=1903263 RepID=UPI0008F885A7|nr:CBS and ACT domain-containing protein [Traorella massiliensis]
MYVKNEMTANPITINADDVISKAADIMSENNLHRLPVMENGKLVGLVTKGLITSKGVGGATSLSVFELNYLLNRTSVKTVMIKLKDLVTISSNKLLEEAASLMLAHDIGCLPVVDDGELVGILTQNDLFKAFLDILGWQRKGSRIEVNVPDTLGILGEISKIFVDNNANITNFTVYRNNDDSTADLILRTTLTETDELEKELNQNGFKVNGIMKK